MQGFKIQTEFFQRARAKVFHQHIALQREVAQDLFPLVCFQVDHNAALVAIDAQVIRAFPFRERGTPAASLIAFGRLHLDHIRTQVTENHRTIRTSQHAA